MRSSGKSRAIHASLALANAVFLWVMVGYALHNRYAADDFDVLARLRQNGFWDAQWSFYVGWSGRWVANFWQTVFVSPYPTGAAGLVAFTLTTVLFWIASVRALLDTILLNFFPDNQMRPWGRWNVSMIFAQLLLWATPNMRESIFWISGSTCYSWAVAAFLVSLAFFFRPGAGLYGKVLLAAASAWAVGSNESIAFLFFGLLVLGAPLWLRSAGGKWRSNGFIAFISAGISFAIVALAPGNAARHAQLHPGPGLPGAVIRLSYGLVPWMGRTFWGDRDWILIGAVLAYLLPSILGEPSIRDRKLACRSMGIGLAWSAGLFIFVQSALNFPAIFLGGAFPPDRAWIMNSSLGLLLIFLMAGLAGILFPLRAKGSKAALSVLLVAGVLTMAGYRASLFSRQLPSISAYSAAYDLRERELIGFRESGRTAAFQLTALPYTDVYDIPSPRDTNQQSAYGLKFSLLPAK